MGTWRCLRSAGGRGPTSSASAWAAASRCSPRPDVKEYPDAAHGFLNRVNLGPFSPLARVGGFGYHHPSAEDAWGRILRFFETHLRSAA